MTDNGKLFLAVGAAVVALGAWKFFNNQPGSVPMAFITPGGGSGGQSPSPINRQIIPQPALASLSDQNRFANDGLGQEFLPDKVISNVSGGSPEYGPTGRLLI